MFLKSPVKEYMPNMMTNFGINKVYLVFKHTEISYQFESLKRTVNVNILKF